MDLIWIVLIAILAFIIYKKFISKFKFPKTTAISVFVGGVKSGKSASSLACCLSNYKRAIRSWRLSKFFIKLFNTFRKEPLPIPEKPLLYSTIPLSVPYVQVTTEHLLRKRRFAFKSVVFIDEASLVADSQLIKDKEINTELLLFFKLFGHETHGGKCIVNTHCITDLHFALKRCTSQYFYIHHISKYIPFLTAVKMREERFAEDGTNMNVYNEDVEDSMKTCIMRKSIFKKYDSFCFSYLTDHLPTDTIDDLIIKGKKDSLKATEVVSFRPEFANLADKIQSEIKFLNLKEDLSNEKEIS